MVNSDKARGKLCRFHYLYKTFSFGFLQIELTRLFNITSFSIIYPTHDIAVVIYQKKLELPHAAIPVLPADFALLVLLTMLDLHSLVNVPLEIASRIFDIT